MHNGQQKYKIHLRILRLWRGQLDLRRVAAILDLVERSQRVVAVTDLGRAGLEVVIVIFLLDMASTVGFDVELLTQHKNVGI